MKPTNEKNKRRPYSCPDCGAGIVFITVFTGWEREKVNAKTGETEKVLAAERSEVHETSLGCSNTVCDWNLSEPEDEDEE